MPPLDGQGLSRFPLDVWVELWLDNDMSTNELRTNLLTEVQTRVENGEDVDQVVAELKTRPEWEMVAKAQGLR